MLTFKVVFIDHKDVVFDRASFPGYPIEMCANSWDKISTSGSSLVVSGEGISPSTEHE